MDKYALAKLVEWAGESGIQGRKRLQKIVYFLQRDGCPLEADYSLHHYGPYSRDVAQACDQLTAADLFSETTTGNAVGVEFAYRLTGSGAVALRQTEARLPEQAKSLEKYKSLALELIAADLRILEVGSTIAYFKEKHNWSEAVVQACAFKRIETTGEIARRSEALARKVLEAAR